MDSSSATDRHAFASALDWWREAGVDVDVAEAPRDWLAPTQLREAAAGDPATAPAVAEVRTWPTALPSFESWRVGEDAPERAWAKRLFGANGDANSGLMVLIDMPEREDADAGQLLSGPAGRLFDRMLAAVRQTRQSIYLLPFASARPTGGRIPDSAIGPLSELARHHLGLAAPKRALILGNAASRALLGSDSAHARADWQALRHKDGEVMAIASLAPRLLLERPECKADAWRDLQIWIGGFAG